MLQRLCLPIFQLTPIINRDHCPCCDVYLVNAEWRCCRMGGLLFHVMVTYKPGHSSVPQAVDIILPHLWCYNRPVSSVIAE